MTTALNAVTIHPGDTGVAIPVNVTSNGYLGPVTVTMTGLPSGMTVTPANLSTATSGTIYLSATVAADQESFPGIYPNDPNTATKQVNVLAFAGSMQSSVPLALTVSLTNPSYVPAKLTLPQLKIDTAGVAISSKTVDVSGTVTITSADGSTSYLPNASDADNTAIFHVHGNTTAEMPKLPYAMKLNTSLDLLTQMGLSCPYVTSSGKPTCDKSKSYILLANYDDKTMLRDWAASALANAIPYGGNFLSPNPLPAGSKGTIPTPSGTSALLPWAPHSLFVELYLNGQYEGTYQLIEEVKVDSHRVNITEMTETDTTGAAVTGGYLMEIDQRQAEDYVFTTPQGVYVGLTDPDYTPEVPQQTSYITDYVQAAEANLFSSSYTDPVSGWRSYFDQAAAVNYYIVNDLMGNGDAARFYSSVYLYKDRSNPFLYMGPVWDFDVSSGNTNGYGIADPTVPWMQNQNPWYAQWFTDPSFKSAAAQQWNNLKNGGVLSAWMSFITQEAATLQQAQTNNFGRCPMQGIRVWPNLEAVGTYTGEVNFMLDWLTLRMGYIDGFLNGTATTATAITVPATTWRAGTSQILTAKVNGASPTGSVTFSYNSIVLGQAALDGSGNATLTTSNLPAGTWYLEAYYDGDSGNAISGALSPAVTVQPPLIQTVTNLNPSVVAAQYGSSVLLTASVVGMAGSAAPSGTMTFAANGSALGSAAVSDTGLATLTTTTLAGGIDTVQASYSGDTTFAASISNSIAETIATNFTLTAAGPTAQTISSGGTANYTFSLAPIGGFYPGPVAMSITGVPAGYSAVFSTSTLAAGAGSQQITLSLVPSSIATGSQSALSRIALACLVLLPFGAVPGRKSHGKRRLPLICFLACLGGTLLVGVEGCGGPLPVQQYNVTVTGTSGDIQHSVTVTLGVRA